VNDPDALVQLGRYDSCVQSLIGSLVELVQRGFELRRERERLREQYTERRINDLLRAIEVNEPDSGKAKRAQAELSYFLTALQVNSADRGSRQLALATVAIAVATLGLIGATVALAVVTAKH
jgi:hypothetical protein